MKTFLASILFMKIFFLISNVSNAEMKKSTQSYRSLKERLIFQMTSNTNFTPEAFAELLFSINLAAAAQDRRPSVSESEVISQATLRVLSIVRFYSIKGDKKLIDEVNALMIEPQSLANSLGVDHYLESTLKTWHPSRKAEMMDQIDAKISQ